MKKVTKSSNDDEIRSQMHSLLMHGGIPEDLASKLVDPSGLTASDVATIEQSEQMKVFREYLPKLQEDFIEHLTKQHAYTVIGQEIFIELVRRGFRVRDALKKVGLEMSENDIIKLELANRES